MRYSDIQRVEKMCVTARKLLDYLSENRITREDYLLAMERSPVRDTELMQLLKNALTDRVKDPELYMHSIDASYGYEGYAAYRAEEV